MKPYKIFEKKFVDARELYTFLEVKSEFYNWIKTAISNLKLKEGLDYLYLDPNTQQNAKCDLIQYKLLSNKAKHIAMMEETQKGKEVRQYFSDIADLYSFCQKKKEKDPDYIYTEQEELQFNFHKLGVDELEFYELDLDGEKLFLKNDQLLASSFQDFIQKAKDLAAYMSNLTFEGGVIHLEEALEVHQKNLQLMNVYIEKHSGIIPNKKKKK